MHQAARAVRAYDAFVYFFFFFFFFFFAPPNDIATAGAGGRNVVRRCKEEEEEEEEEVNKCVIRTHSAGRLMHAWWCMVDGTRESERRMFCRSVGVELWRRY